MILTAQQLARQFLREATDNAVMRLRNAVRPIYGVTDSGDPYHIGSAVLLDLDGTMHLLTAAHVLDHTDKTTLHLGGDNFIPLALDAQATTAPNGVRRADRFDFAIAELPQAMLAQLTRASFVTRADLSNDSSSAQGRSFVCLGFPNSQNKPKRHKGPKVKPTLGIYASVGRPASYWPAAPEATHILVDYNPKTSMDDLGNKVSSISIPGFSGGAIVDLGRPTAEGLSLKAEPKLAALLIEMRSGAKVIVGTRLSTILAAVEARL